jgi:hypothetical protein
MDRTKNSSTQNKHHPMTQTLWGLPDTYCARLEAKTLGLTAKQQAGYDHYNGKLGSCRNGTITQIMDPTKNNSTQTKPNPVIQTFYVHPKAYYKRMKAKNYVYLPSITLAIMVIT